MRDDQLENLQKYFNIGVDKESKEFGIRSYLDNNEFTYHSLYDSRIEKLFKYWKNSCHDDPSSFEDRKSMYDDMDMMFFNSPIISKAVTLFTDETVQADSNTKTIGIESNNTELKDFISKFFDEIKIEKFY